MEQMIRAGMNVARLNLSHGDFENHAKIVQRLRNAAKNVGRRVAIMADLPGPKMRVGEIKNEPIMLQVNDTFILTTEEIVGDASRAFVTFPMLPKVVKAGDVLYLNDGIIRLKVISCDDTDVTCRVEAGGELRSRKGLNLPGIDLGISAFTPRDRECLKLACDLGLDAVSQ
jgi:pyruvate kinase